MDTLFGVFQRTIFFFSLFALSGSAYAFEFRYGENNHHHRNDLNSDSTQSRRVPTPASVQNAPAVKVLESVGGSRSRKMRSGGVRSLAADPTPSPIVPTPEPTSIPDPTSVPSPTPTVTALLPTATPVPTAPPPPPTATPSPTVAPPPPPPSPTPSGCQCNAGYAPTADGSRCVKNSTAPANPVTGVPMVRGDENGNYGSNFALVDSGLSNLPSGNSTSAFQMLPGAWADFMPQVNFSQVPTSSMILPAGSTAAHWQFLWRRFGNYSHQNPTGVGRFGTSNLAIKIGGGNPMEASATGTYTKSYCVNVPVEKSYLIHVGADNTWKVKVNGSPYAECNDAYCFKTGFFIKQVFPAGKSVVELQYTNEGGFAGIWFEILDNSLDQIKTVSNESQLNKVFSTSENPNGMSWDYSAANPACPAGYSLNRCDSQPVCTKIEYESCH